VGRGLGKLVQEGVRIKVHSAKLGKIGNVIGGRFAAPRGLFNKKAPLVAGLFETN
jgi:hypothetical protein